MDAQFYKMEPLLDAQLQGPTLSNQSQDNMEWSGPVGCRGEGNITSNASDNSASSVEKPQLNNSNSLSSIFFNNIYNDVDSSGVGNSATLETDKDDTGADIASAMLRLLNENAAVPDLKSTLRCATPIDINVNPLLFATSASPNTAYNDNNNNNNNNSNNNTSEFKEPQLSLSPDMTKKATTNAGSNEECESLFTYLTGAKQQPNTPANDYYSIHTPIASDSSLSPYQRDRLGSGVSTGSGFSERDDFLMIPADSLSDATSVTYLDEHNITKFNDFSSIDASINYNNSNTTFDNFDKNNMIRDRLFSSFSEVETLNAELDETMNEARLQLPISLPSQGTTNFYLGGAETLNETGVTQEACDTTNCSINLHSHEECNEADHCESHCGSHCDSESEGENTNTDYNCNDDDESDYSDGPENKNEDEDEGSVNGDVKRGVMALRRARNFQKAKRVGSAPTTAFSTSKTNNIAATKTDKQFKCNKCSSSFTRKTRLTEHINRVHLGKIYHFKCNQCGTRLSSKENLTRHSIVHTDKFKCKRCNRRFDRSYRFQRHLEKCNVSHY